MKINNILRNLFGKKEKDSKIKELKEQIKFSDIKIWVEKKRKENFEDEKNALILIKKRIKSLTDELEEGIKSLENVDINSSKVENKVKVIVKGNLKGYINNLNILIKNLYEINETKYNKLDIVVNRLNKSLFDFKKSSEMNYQKATFLIGEEMANIKKSMLNFSKEITRIIDSNRYIIDFSKQIDIIEEKIKSFDETNKTIKDIEKNIQYLEKNILNIEQNIETIKQNPDYSKELNKKQEIVLSEKLLKNEVAELKSMIDFKALTKAFHFSEQKMSLIKNLRDNFEDSFFNNQNNILNLINEANINNKLINSKIENIQKLKNQLHEDKKTSDSNKSFDLKIKELEKQLDSLRNELSDEKKRMNKIEENLQKDMEIIKKELFKLNVKILDD